MQKRWKKLVVIGVVAGMVSAQPLTALAEEAEGTAAAEQVTVEETLPAEETEADETDAATGEDETDDVSDATDEAVSETLPEVKEETYVMESEVLDAGESGRGTWQSTGGRWWFRFQNGGYAKNNFYTIDGKVYYFDAQGYMVTGWRTFTETDEDGPHTYWRYFNSGGAMQFGWYQEGGKWYYFDKDNGIMYANGYWNIDGDGLGYYFRSNGSMVTGWNLEDGDWYYYASNGKMVEGWLKEGGIWYYLNPEMLKGFQDINGATYYFDESGHLFIGWKKISDQWYYFSDTGIVKGWYQEGGKWYYLDPEDGFMHCNGYEVIGNKGYYFNTDGSMRTGWSFEEADEENQGDWYYYSADGSEYTGWLQSGGQWYYLDDYMYADGLYKIDGKLYGFRPNGSMITGWYKPDKMEAWFYFDANGVAHDGWLQSGGNWYWIINGRMNTNEYVTMPNGSVARFNKNGIWIG